MKTLNYSDIQNLITLYLSVFFHGGTSVLNRLRSSVRTSKNDQSLNMVEQIQQQDLQEKIDTLTFEIQSLSEELEAAKKAKSQYVRELMNDPDAQERRIELLAGGYQNVSEFSEAQLAKVSDFINIIRGLERGISDRHRSIEEIQRTITAQQKRFVAESAIEPKIEKFNECLGQLRQAWEDLRSVGNEHGAEFSGQPLPEDAELYETKPKPGYSGTWLKISFGD